MVGYFSSLFAAFAVALSDVWKQRAKRGSKDTAFAAALYASSAFTFGVTWYQIIAWLVEDAAAYPDTWVWVRDADLFVQAYRLVTLTPAHWLWSCQLLTFVAPWVLYVSLSARDMPLHVTLSYIWLGFAGAIGLSLPLHLLRNDGFSPPKLSSSAVANFGPASLWLLLLGAVGSAAALPSSLKTWTFGWVLGALHVTLLLVPFAVKWGGMGVAGLHFKVFKRAMLLMGISLVCVHLANIAGLFVDSPPDAGAADRIVAAITSNRCQASITFDLLCVSCVTGAVLVWTSPAKGLLFVALMPLLSPGAVLALWLATLPGLGQKR
eukprot:TRINITY_DN20013_c1_g2_i1.p1 TRINITY_DN20013_c1_g2~~TRINITY_DN20013_c1_g2_i1.p1  ORF type:complete len:355 (+),score=101.62 TRINITY_DN20013_c1_g2_i1:101-1066(+)